MIYYAIYSRAGSFVCRFDSLESAERWRGMNGRTIYTIRKEVWR